MFFFQNIKIFGLTWVASEYGVFDELWTCIERNTSCPHGTIVLNIMGFGDLVWIISCRFPVPVVPLIILSNLKPAWIWGLEADPLTEFEIVCNCCTWPVGTVVTLRRGPIGFWGLKRGPTGASGGVKSDGSHLLGSIFSLGLYSLSYACFFIRGLFRPYSFFGSVFGHFSVFMP